MTQNTDPDRSDAARDLHADRLPNGKLLVYEPDPESDQRGNRWIQGDSVAIEP